MALKKRATGELDERIAQIERDGCLFRARGNTWRRVGSKGHFWVCDLVMEGTTFSERPRKVYMLPFLEDPIPVYDSLFKRPEYPKPVSASGHTESSRSVAINELAAMPGASVRSNNQQTEHLLKAAESAAIDFKEFQFEPLRRVLSLPFPRLLIGDDVGLGKTTEAGLVASHLVRNGQAERVLVLCPAHLAEKWQYEMRSRFSLPFEIFDKKTRSRLTRVGVRNPWSTHEFVIASMDFAKRFENLRPLRNVEWDLVIIDECHHFVRAAMGMTSRLRQLAEEICTQSPGLLLLSATPFRGGMDEYESLLGLLDPLTLERCRNGELTQEARSRRREVFVRRLKKEVAQGKDFPNRIVQHIDACKLMSKEEESLVVGFSEFIEVFQTSEERKAAHLLSEVLRKRASSSWKALCETLSKVVLDDSIVKLPKDFTTRAQVLQNSFADAKSKALIDFLKVNVVENRNKLVIFTEFIPTLEHICDLLRAKFPKVSFGAITGVDCFARFNGQEMRDGITRTHIEEAFSSADNPLQVMICTDAMSEGVDFQHACHLLLNYELPWSLVRLEQRAGRIDRFGQTKQPIIYNLVLATRATPDQRILQNISDRIEKWREEIGSVSDLVEVMDARELNETLRRGKEDSEFLSVIASDSSIKTNQEAYKLDATQHLDSSPEWTLRQAESVLTERVQAGSSLVAFVLRSLLSGSSKSFLKELPTQGFYQLALPQGWELFGLDGAFGYPTSEHPWLVTFDPCVYRKSEIKALQARRAIGEESEHVHFLSAAHPIVNAALRRFKNKIRANGNIPVLASETPLAEKCMLLFEVVLPASGEKSITLWRGLDTVSPNGNRLNNTDLSKIVETLRPVRAADSFEKQMPTDREWERMVEQGISNGIEQAKDFIHENKKTTELFRNDAAKQKSVLEAIQQQREKKKLPKYLESLANARGQWLSELWEPLIHPDTKEPVVRFAPLAIVLNSGKSR